MSTEVTNSQATAGQRYRSPQDYSVFPLGNEKVLLYSPLARKAIVIPRDVADLCLSMKQFAPLFQHAESWCQQMNLPPPQQFAIQNQLEELVGHGFLLSHDALIERSKHYCPAPTEAEISIEVLGIPTRNRPESLKRCLQSYAQCAAQFDRKPMDFVIVDASDTEESRRANEKTALEIEKQFGFSTYYCGMEEQRAFAQKLIEHSGLAPEVVRFALLNDDDCPISTGCSRNALLLLSVGRLLVQVDDDSICQIMPAPLRNDQLGFSSQPDPRDFWPMDEPAQCMSEDFFALHERLLGKGLGQILAGFPAERINLDLAASSFFRRMESQAGRVAVTALGLAGDSGIANSSFFLTLEGELRERFCGSESDYLKTVSQQRIIRATRHTTLAEGPGCQGFNLGLDNRQMLPPFMPVQRCQDEIFGRSLHNCLDGAYFGHLPWALAHQPMEERLRLRESLWKGGTYYATGNLLILLFTALPVGIRSPDTIKNLSSFGGELIKWGNAPRFEFEERLRLILWSHMQRHLALLQNLLGQYGSKPPSWEFDVQSRILWIKEALTKPEYVFASDLTAKFGEEGGRQMLQRLVLRYGQLLCAWPQLRQAALELRQTGLACLGRQGE